MRFLSTTRPILFIAVIRDDTESGIFMRLLELLFMLHLFVWQHKDALLEFFENVNTVFSLIHSVRYTFSILSNPFPYCP